MQTLIINIKNKNLAKKISWILEYFKKDGLEIITKEDLNDFKLLKTTRNEKNISFERYLKKEK